MRVALLALVAALPACGVTEARIYHDDFALYFDGGDCVEASGLPEAIGSGFTVEAWVHAFNSPPTGRGILVSVGESGALWASPEGTGFGKPNNLASTGWQTGMDVFDDELHHVASTWSAETGGTIYVDGYRSGTGGSWELVPGFDTVRIGCGPERVSPFLGTIDEVRVSSRARYAKNFHVSYEPFEVDGDTVALYHFNQGLGDRVLEERDQFPGTIKGATWADGLLTASEEPGDTSE